MLTGSDDCEKAIAVGFKKAREIFEHHKPSEVEGDPHDDIAQMSLPQVGRWHQYFKGLLAYCVSEASEADLQFSVAKSNYELAKKIAMASIDRNSKTPMWELEATIAEREEIMRHRNDVRKKQAYAVAMKAQLNGLEHMAELFSREISRREQEANQS